MLSERSKQIRRDTITLSKANGGYHWGGCFSIVEILIALYDHVLTSDDRFILSKGHACWPWYVILKEKGFNPRLEGHPSRDPHNGILCTTGSLGHGLPTGVGMAMAKKLKKELGKVYVLMGDGECQEGTTWESLLIAVQQELHNLVVIVDSNGIQGSGRVKNILSIKNFQCVANDLGLTVYHGMDGHNVDNLSGLMNCSNTQFNPHMIIADTVKGKGVSFMEDKPEWHAKWLGDEQEKLALSELE